MAEESGKGELHQVDNAEADDIYDYAKHAIPHNEMLSRLIRNHHHRIQTLEKEIAGTKTEITELKASQVEHQKRRMFRR